MPPACWLASCRAPSSSVTDDEVQRYVKLAEARLEMHDCFEDAMR